MQSYRDPDRPPRPEDGDPNIVPWNRMRILTRGVLMPDFGSSWQGTFSLLALLALVMLILWALMALHLFS